MNTHQPAKALQRKHEDDLESTVDTARLAAQLANPSTGQALDSSVREDLEPKFGHSFENVRIHHDTQADEMAQSVNAIAFTTGQDVYFQKGIYDPTSSDGLELLAHELTHTIQQSQRPVSGMSIGDGIQVNEPNDVFEQAANATKDFLVRRDNSSKLDSFTNHQNNNHTANLIENSGKIQRFSGPEHSKIAKSATNDPKVNINVGSDEKPIYVKFSQMITISGDQFGDLESIKNLSKTELGKEVIIYAIWLAMNENIIENNQNEPKISYLAKSMAKKLYEKLATSNFNHFPNSGSEINAINEYRKYHILALNLAFESGKNQNEDQWRESLTYESFGAHFLTDSFSSGHIRLPRFSIQNWYDKHFPPKETMDKLIYGLSTIAMGKPLKPSYGDEGSFLESLHHIEIEEAIREQGGDLLDGGLGGLVSLAWHDADNENGLNITSDLGVDGNPDDSIHKFYGDGNLNRSDYQFQLASLSVKTSIEDLDFAKKQGKSAEKIKEEIKIFQAKQVVYTELFSRGKFKSELFLPKIVEGENPEISWKWGRINSTLRGYINNSLSEFGIQMLNESAKLSSKSDKSIEEKLTIRAKETLGNALKDSGIKLIENILGKKAGGS
jgi:Domain of unknown function (DUF4157)